MTALNLAYRFERGARSSARSARLAATAALVVLCITGAPASAQLAPPMPERADGAGTDAVRWRFQPGTAERLPSAGIVLQPYILSLRCNPRRRRPRALTLFFFKRGAGEEKRHGGEMTSLGFNIDGREAPAILVSRRPYQNHLLYASFVDLPLETATVFGAIRRARRGITMKINGENVAFPVRGSTRALGRLRKACRL